MTDEDRSSEPDPPTGEDRAGGEDTAEEEGSAYTGDTQIAEGLLVNGAVTDVETVGAAEVPLDHPLVDGGEGALALKVDLSPTESVTAYLPAEDGESDHVATLRSLAGIDDDDTDSLEGSTILFEVVEGELLPVAQGETKRGSPLAFYGVLAGLAPSISIALFSFFGMGGAVNTEVFWGLFLVCTFLILPLSLYLDALYLRTTTDWDGRPLVWALLAIVPPLYVVVAPYYLLARESARPLVSAAPQKS